MCNHSNVQILFFNHSHKTDGGRLVMRGVHKPRGLGFENDCVVSCMTPNLVSFVSVMGNARLMLHTLHRRPLEIILLCLCKHRFFVLGSFYNIECFGCYTTYICMYKSIVKLLHHIQLFKIRLT